MSHTYDTSHLHDVRVFVAPTMADALAQVRRCLGDDAIIVRTREVPRTGIGRWLTGPEIEVTAGVEPPPLPSEPAVFPSDITPHERSQPASGIDQLPEPDFGHLQSATSVTVAHDVAVEPSVVFPPASCTAAADEPRIPTRPAIQPAAERQPATVRPVRADRHTTRPAGQRENPNDSSVVSQQTVPMGELNLAEEDSIGSRIAAIEAAVQQLTQADAATGPLFDRLLDRGFDAAVARELLQDIANQDTRRDGEVAALEAAVASRVEVDWERPGRPGEQRRIAFVGPSGVGKTTTLAKVAAAAILNDSQSVGLITLDAHRVGAAAQMNAYAEMLSVPLRVVRKREHARRAIGELADCDLLLVDTPGLGPLESDAIATMRSLLRTLNADESWLCLSAASSLGANRKAAAAFDVFRPEALLLTKLDEAAGTGQLLSLQAETRLPLRLLATGQNVPTDFEWAHADRVARILLQTEPIDPAAQKAAA